LLRSRREGEKRCPSLTFSIDRAGKDLPATRKKTLEAAKDELRKAFGKS